MRKPPEEIHNPQNSQLSIVRFYGGCTLDGAHYVVVPVGTKGDWKLVRDDVLKARAKADRAARKAQKRKAWIKVNRPTVLEHQRPHDTHAPIKFAKGVYEVRRQREYTPEGWRRVAD